MRKRSVRGTGGEMNLRNLLPVLSLSAFMLVLVACVGDRQTADTPTLQAKAVDEVEVEPSPTNESLKPEPTSPSVSVPPTNEPPTPKSKSPSVPVSPRATLEPFGFVHSRPDDLYTPALPVPDFSKIELTWLGDGFTQVSGSIGAIPGDYPVYVVSPNTGHAALTISDIDGSFSAQIVAPPGSWVIVKYDPTGGQWLHPYILQDTRPTPVNAAVGAMAQVPFEPPSGDGVPFVVSGSTVPGHLDFTLRGLMTGTFESGGSVTLSGNAIIYAAGDSAVELTGQRLGLHTRLSPFSLIPANLGSWPTSSFPPFLHQQGFPSNTGVVLR